MRRLRPLIQGRLALTGAALAWSSAGVFQRALSADPVTQIVGRAVFASITISLFVLVTERRLSVRSFVDAPATTLGYAVAQAMSSAAFIAALNNTSVANVLVLQATAPLIAAALGRVFLGEVVTRGTLVATLSALGGVLVMAGGPGGGLNLGLAFGFVMATSLAVRIVLARRRPEVSMVPASCAGQLMLIVCLGPFAHLGGIGSGDVALLAALGAGQGVGSVLLSLGAPLIPAVEGGLLSLLETVLGPLWVWLAHGETPAGATIVGGLVILASVVVGTLAARHPTTRGPVAAAPGLGLPEAGTPVP